MNTKRILWAAVAASLTVAALLTRLDAQQPSAAATLVADAAQALGGRDRIEALRSIRMIGYGEMIDGFGLSNIAADRYAPERLNNLLEFERTFDLTNDRMRTRVRRRTNFTFANAGANLGLVRVNEVLDGQIAFNVAENGNANRVVQRPGNQLHVRAPRFLIRPGNRSPRASRRSQRASPRRRRADGCAGA